MAHPLIEQAKRIAVLSGAGISAESGIATFRGKDGLWKNYRPEELATPQAFDRNPELVWEWYAMRLNIVLSAKPNQAHYLLANLEKEKDLTLVTQNVDRLHHRAGSANVLELHGNISHSRCLQCGHLSLLEKDFSYPPLCKVCGGRTRPNVVWFGETLPISVFQKSIQAFESCDLALIIGTSAVVEPAASLARLAKNKGAKVIEINPQTTSLSHLSDLSIRAGAAKGLQELLNN